MTAPNISTFDLPSPRRPGKDDFNGLAKVDDEQEPPDPRLMPNAREWNTMGHLNVAAGAVLPLLVLSIAGGVNPPITGFVCPGTKVGTNTFTITRTGTGNVLISWPADTFPPPSTAPTVSLNSGPGTIWAEIEGDGVRVRTYDSAGAPADQSFTVGIH